MLSKVKRFGALLLALALLLNIGSPVLTVSAEGTATDAPVTYTLSLTAENCILIDPEGNPILDGHLVNAGDSFAFQVKPNDGYKLDVIEYNSNTIIPDEEDVIVFTPASDFTISAKAVEKSAPEFTVKVEPEYLAQQKTLSILDLTSDDEIAFTAYSTVLFEEFADLSFAVSEGVAFEMDMMVDVTVNGTYYVYAVDTAGRMTVVETVVEGIDTTPPTITGIVRDADAPKYSFTVTDNIGVVAVTVKDSAGVAQDVTNEGDVYSVTVSDYDTYTVSAVDSAGNIAEDWFTEAASPEIFVVAGDDIGMHTITVTNPNNATVSIVVTDSTGNVQNLTTISDGTYSCKVSANGTFTVSVTDDKGGSAEATFVEDRFIYSPEILVTASDAPGGYRITVTNPNKAEMTLTVIDAEGAQLPYQSDDDGAYSIQLRRNGIYTITVTDAKGGSATATIEEEKILPPQFGNIQRTQDSLAGDSVYTFEVTSSNPGSITVTAEDANSTSIQVTILNENTFSVNISDNGDFTLTAVDAYGLTNTYVIHETGIDLIAPVISDITRSEEGVVGEAHYTFFVTDDGYGVESVSVINSETGDVMTVEDNGEGKYTVTIQTNGIYTIRVVDKAGNTVTASLTEKEVDVAPPTVLVIRDHERIVQKVTYTLHVSDTYGVVSVTVRDEANQEYPVSPNGADQYTVEIPNNGKYTVLATDTFGNTASLQISEEKIDNTAPEIGTPVRSATGWLPQAVYTFKVTDANGIRSVHLCYASGVEQLLYPVEADTYEITLEANGFYTIRAEDTIGNVSSITITEQEIDNAIPTISYVRDTTGWSAAAEYTITADDNVELAYVTVAKDSSDPVTLEKGSNGTYSFTATVNGSYHFCAVDLAGNRTAITVEENLIDHISPVLSDILRDTKDWATKSTYCFTVTDAEPSSGIAFVKLTVGGVEQLLEEQDGTYSFTITENTDATVTVTDVAGHTVSAAFTETRVDTTAPTISVPTREPVSGWAESATYRFTVKENQSGLKTVKLSLDNGETRELTSETGSYTFTVSENTAFLITAEDSLGNASSYNGVEDHVDSVAPVITNFHRETKDWAFSSYYAFHAEDATAGIASVKMIFNDETPVNLTADSDGNYRFLAEENGTYTILITDIVGNSVSQSLSENQIDRNAPTIADVKRDVDHWSQTSTYTFTATDSASGIASVTVMLADKVVPHADEQGNCSFTVSENGEYTVTVIDTVGNVQTVVITENQIDLAAPNIHSVTPQEQWDAETNEVVFSVTDNNELVSVVVSDNNGNSYPASALGEDCFSAILVSNGDYTVTATDRAGNYTTENFSIWHIDTAAPSKPVLESSANEAWTNTDVTISASASDEQSGVASYWYSDTNAPFDISTWTQMSLSNGIGQVTLSDEQSCIYYAVAVDAVGRVSEIETINVRIDKTAPDAVSMAHDHGEGSGYNCTVNGRDIYNDKMSFTAAATDSASGIVAYEYKIVGQNAATDWTRIQAGAEGIHPSITFADDVAVIYVRAWDEAGNVTEAFTNYLDSEPVSFILENTPEADEARASAPTVAITADGNTYTGEWTNKDLTFVVNGGAAVSGVHHYEYRITSEDGLTDTEWMTVGSGDELNKLLYQQQINGTFYFRAISNAGNHSNTASVRVRVQKELPALAAVTFDKPTGKNNWYTHNPNYTIQLPQVSEFAAPVTYIITLSHAQNQAAAAITEAVTYNGSNAPTIDADGIWRLVITSIDEAGNMHSTEDQVIQVDKGTPGSVSVQMDGIEICNSLDEGAVSYDSVYQCTHIQTADFTIFRNKNVTLTVTAKDKVSGIANIYYQVNATGGVHYTGTWTKIPADGLVLTPNSRNYLYFKIEDSAGNISYHSAESVLLDDTAPSGSAEGSAIAIVPETANLSAHGFYYGNVTVDVSVVDPVVSNAFSGLVDVTYRVLCNGEVTQSGSIFNTAGATYTEGRISAWSGKVTIDAQKNNSSDVILEITAVDKAGNVRTSSTKQGAIKIDVTAPVITASYAGNNPKVVRDDVTYFTGKRILTVNVEEVNFRDVQSLVYVTNTDTGDISTYEWTTNGSYHTTIIPISADGHYKVTFSVTDAAGNATTNATFEADSVAVDAFVLDNTAPKVEVTFTQDFAMNGHYFAADRTAVITVKERNFNADDFDAKIQLKNTAGQTVDIAVDKWDSDGDTHTAILTFTQDGSYTLDVTTTDIPGHQAAATTYSGSTPNAWIIDKTIQKAVVAGILDGKAYADEVAPVITFEDVNPDTMTFRLLQTRRNEINKDVTKELLSEGSVPITKEGNTLEAVLDVFPREKEYDGIYTLIITSYDMAGNRAEREISFCVNRFGSVYVYSEDLITAMGGHFQSITKDFTITEINPSRLVSGSATVQITRDGTPIAEPAYTITPRVNGTEKPGESGWYEYIYSISRDNFTEDGVYTIVVSAKDTAGNLPENTAEEMAIQFAVDNSAPELTSVIGLEDSIVNANSLDVNFLAMDNTGLASIAVYINGNPVERWTVDGYRYEGSFQIPAGMDQHVRIVITDNACNVMDTDAEDFAPGYAWQDVTVSTNFLLRFYANKPLFWGSVSVIIMLACYFCFIRIRKKEEEEANPAQ